MGTNTCLEWFVKFKIGDFYLKDNALEGFQNWKNELEEILKDNITQTTLEEKLNWSDVIHRLS